MADIRVNSRLLGLRDVQVHVEDTGGLGRQVILIHGWPLSSESWKNQVPALQAAGYRVITYERRGFGRSDKPKTGYDYDTLTEDLHNLIDELAITDITLVGFSMGGGEVARYASTFNEEGLHSLVFASAIPPYLLKTDYNPDGPLEKSHAAEWTKELTTDENAFYDTFTKQFFSRHGDGTIIVSEAERQEALAMAHEADKTASLECMSSFGTTDFRDDLQKATLPTLVIHGDADGIVPFEGSGKRTHEAIAHSELHLIAGGPHGVTVSHAQEFNDVLIKFLAK